MDQLNLFGEPEGQQPIDKKKVEKVQKKPLPQKEIIEPTLHEEQLPIAVIEEEEPAENTEKVDETQLKKVYYTITEVAKMFDVNASLLRFWEKEFKQLGKIKKNKKGDRYYNKENIRHLNIIYYLLKERRMTIEGARDMIKNKRKSTIAQFDIVENLQQIRSFLVDIKTSLQQEK